MVYKNLYPILSNRDTDDQAENPNATFESTGEMSLD